MYYSRKYLQEFYGRTRFVLDELKMTYEFIFVDDGSPDDSLLVALHLQNLDSNIKVVELSRNYGHQRAIMTGLQQASGDFVFLIDCDLEEAPELLNDFWKEMTGQANVDVVYGVQIKRKGSWFERLSDALEMAALLIGTQPGDEIIMPSYTFVSTPNAFVLRGATVIFADSSRDNPNIDVDKIESLITKKTRAIVVVHYAGFSCDMDTNLLIKAGHLGQLGT
ncbi:hypothetical protein Egran_05852 [Elaphomyces granulatus]|uniref:Uncharacterized protein n=1 Tax=Elaphomyces granulatus TaxID=519963 RepID=A0A232LQE7_9EURO|nr:hypothetical protein Egran_05852 [Elaphomyces granulatus]